MNQIPFKLVEKYLLEKQINVFHFPDLCSKLERKRILVWLESVSYVPFYDHGHLARLEAKNIANSPMAKTFRNFTADLSHRLGFRALVPEVHAFKYLPGHYVPWHVDRPRHKLILMGYFGDFNGGGYEYRVDENANSQIQPACGDGILAINATRSEGAKGLLHRVRKIDTGIRYTLAVSMISSPA